MGLYHRAQLLGIQLKQVEAAVSVPVFCDHGQLALREWDEETEETENPLHGQG